MNLVKVTYKEEIEEIEEVEDVEVEVKVKVDVVAEAKVILWCKMFDVDKNVLMME